jgi:hypothetical protein
MTTIVPGWDDFDTGSLPPALALATITGLGGNRGRARL